MVAAVGILVSLVTTGAVAGAATWSAPATIPSAETYAGSPALATYDGDLYAVWAGQSSPYHLYYSKWNGTSWSSEVQIPSALTNYITGPTVAVYDGDLYVVWEGQSSPYNLWYSAFNGSSWSAQAEVPSALTVASATPGLASYDGDLYLSWVGDSSAADIWYSAFNGSTWSAETTIPSASSFDTQGCSSSLVSYDGYLVAAWIGSGLQVDYALFDGTWVSPFPLGKVDSALAGPDMTVNGNDLDIASVSYKKAKVQVTTFNGKKWGSAKAIKDAEVGVVVAPGIAAYGGSLYAAWIPGSGPSPIDYSYQS